MKDETVLLRIGRVVKTHGVTGSILVAPDSDDPTRLLHIGSLYLGSRAETSRRYVVVDARTHVVKKHTGVVLKLEGVETIDAARLLLKQHAYANEGELPPLDENEYFLDDLIGMRVINSDGIETGVVREVVEYPAHPMLVVERDGSDVLIPLVIPDIIVDMDSEARLIHLAEWEGLVNE